MCVHLRSHRIGPVVRRELRGSILEARVDRFLGPVLRGQLSLARVGGLEDALVKCRATSWVLRQSDVGLQVGVD